MLMTKPIIGPFWINFNKTSVRSNKPILCNLCMHIWTVTSLNQTTSMAYSAMLLLQSTSHLNTTELKGQKGFNSFTSNIEQINVLKCGVARTPNPYK